MAIKGVRAQHLDASPALLQEAVRIARRPRSIGTRLVKKIYQTIQKYNKAYGKGQPRLNTGAWFFSFRITFFYQQNGIFT